MLVKSVRGNYNTRFWRGQNVTAVEGNASVYQVYPVCNSRVTGVYYYLIYLKYVCK